MQISRGFEYGVIHFLAPEAGALADIVEKHLQMDRETTLRLLDFGAIYLANKRIIPFPGQNLSEILQMDLKEKDYLRVHTKPRRFPQVKVKDRIVFENEYMLVVDKPARLPVHASVDNLHENLLAYLEKELQQKLYITHRLDTATRGLLVIAKTPEFQTEFNFLIKDQGIKKIYQATVQTPGPDLKILKHYMEPSPRAPKTVRADSFAGGLFCQLEILSSEPSQYEGFVDLRVQLLTGRTHQIRAQLCAEGFPIRGDHLYGGMKVYHDEQIDLTALELSFIDPISKIEHHFRLMQK